jgi:glycosyltransferase involved in cell wall biosynthesis
MRHRVSVVATVYNESASIDALFDSLRRQTRCPDEVIIVDGGSRDDTLARLEGHRERGDLPLRAWSLPGCNIAAGRNAAIAAAAGPIIAVVDAGLRLEDRWLEAITGPFEGYDAPDVVSGFFVADPHTPFERALGAVTLPLLEEIDPKAFQPSSRSVAFRRDAWAAVGGYPEWLDYCEDLAFDFQLRDVGCRFVMQPDALVHFRPRPTLRAFFRQYYRYARGDGKADLWLARHLIRYVTYLVGLPALVVLGAAHQPLWFVLALAGLAAMMRTPLRRLAPHLRPLSWGERLAVVAWLPVIRVTGDVAKMLGYPAGLWWRWRHAPTNTWARRWL